SGYDLSSVVSCRIGVSWCRSAPAAADAGEAGALLPTGAMLLHQLAPPGAGLDGRDSSAAMGSSWCGVCMGPFGSGRGRECWCGGDQRGGWPATALSWALNSRTTRRAPSLETV